MRVFWEGIVSVLLFGGLYFGSLAVVWWAAFSIGYHEGVNDGREKDKVSECNAVSADKGCDEAGDSEGAV